jgi:hypothetical protein
VPVAPEDVEVTPRAKPKLFRALSRGVVRAGRERDTPQVGELAEGELLTAAEVRAAVGRGRAALWTTLGTILRPVIASHTRRSLGYQMAQNSDGQLRVRFARGWVSVVASNGSVLLEEVRRQTRVAPPRRARSPTR